LESTDEEETDEREMQPSGGHGHGRSLTRAERDIAAVKLGLFRDEIWAALGYKRIFCPVPPSTLFSDRSIQILLAALEYPFVEEQVKRVLDRETIRTHRAVKQNTARITAIITMCIQPTRRLDTIRAEDAAWFSNQGSTSESWQPNSQPEYNLPTVRSESDTLAAGVRTDTVTTKVNSSSKRSISPTNDSSAEPGPRPKRGRPSKADIAAREATT
jgi:hypothetical protein